MSWNGQRKLTIPAGEVCSDVLDLGILYSRPDLHIQLFRENAEPSDGVVVEAQASRNAPWFVVYDDTEEPFDLRHVRANALRLRAAESEKEDRIFSVVGGPEVAQ